MTDQYAVQRAFLVQAIRNAEQSPDDSGGYLSKLAAQIEVGQAAQIDTWIALDAIKLAQAAECAGWTSRGEEWLAAGCPPIKDWKPE